MPRTPDTLLPSRRRWLGGAAAALAAIGIAMPAAAQITLEGHTYPAAIELGGQALVLQGVGMRAVGPLKGYTAALYLVQRARTTEAIVAMAGAKRIRMTMIVDVDAAEFAKAVGKGVARNTPAAEQAGLAARVAEFDRQVLAVGKVKKGDVIDLDFLPEAGMRFAYNGKPRGEPIPGADFYGAVLRIFLGQRPVDADLKADWLSGK
jgi:hypothetical protein